MKTKKEELPINYEKLNSVNYSNYIEEWVESNIKNNTKVLNFVMEKGKFNEKYITLKKCSQNIDFVYEKVHRVVLFEKIGNSNKGVVEGLHLDYVGIERKNQRV